MYKNFFKRQWIGQDMIDYIKSLPKFYRVTYEVEVGGRSVPFPFRNEDGNIVADDSDLHAQNVVSLTVHYQQNGDCERIGVFGKLDNVDLELFKKAFARLERDYPTSRSNVSASHLHIMQPQLRDEIERVTKTESFHKGPNLLINLSGATQLYRDRMVPFLQRLGENCVPVTVSIDMTNATEEQIGATLDELSMYEMERDAELAENVDEI